MKKRGLDHTPFGTLNDGIVPEYSMGHGTSIGHLDAYHWASACVDPVKHSKECKTSLAVLVPHLVHLAGKEL
jgi:hypothetical protein